MNLQTLNADRRARRYLDVLNDPNAPFRQLVDLVDASGDFMAFVSTDLQLPALAAITPEFEQIDEVKKFFASRNRDQTSRFRKFTGIVVLIKMEELDFAT